MMSSITSVQNLPEIIENPTQDLQKSTFLGRAFHKISDARQYSLQSINHVVQSILSKCTYLVSFGYYNFEEVHPEEHMLKSCFANLFKELQKSALYQRQKIKNNPE
ncbi:MAG: hypothetical protein M3A24_03315 [Candidatus Rhabdochlamydia oedothoracis]|nr:hypothetical protein [Candidatus Rhabdochlamydia oedothoracis]